MVGVPRAEGKAWHLSARDLLILTREPLAGLKQREMSDVRSMQAMLRIAIVAGAASVVVGAVAAFWR